MGEGSVRAQVIINTETNLQENRANIKTDEVNTKQGNLSALIGEKNNLSITVILDDKQAIGEANEIIRVSRTPEELSKLTGLVKNTIGFNKERGDTINVVNSTFSIPISGAGLSRQPTVLSPAGCTV